MTHPWSGTQVGGIHFGLVSVTGSDAAAGAGAGVSPVQDGRSDDSGGLARVGSVGRAGAVGAGAGARRAGWAGRGDGIAGGTIKGGGVVGGGVDTGGTARGGVTAIAVVASSEGAGRRWVAGR